MEYVTTTTSSVNGIDCESAVSKKSHCDDEKALLSSFKPVLSRFIGDDVELQKFTLYATQLFAYEKSFPKGKKKNFFNVKHVFKKWFFF